MDELDIRIKNNDTDFVGNFIVSGNALQSEGFSLLYTSISLSSIEIAKFLIERGADINWRNNEIGFTSLILACRKRNLAAVKLLVDNGADLNLRSEAGMTALEYAIRSENSSIISYLMKLDNDIPLTSYVLSGQIRLLVQLLENGADVSQLDKDGRGVLPEIFRFDYPVLGKRLIEKGADVNMVGMGGETSLHVALLQNKIELVEYLLKKNADPNCHDYKHSDEFPLMIAISQKNIIAVKTLLESGADPSVPDPYGMLPINFAAEMKVPGIVEILEKWQN